MTTTPDVPGSGVSRPVPRYARFVRGLQQRYVIDMPGGPRIVRFATVINFQKCLMFVYLAALMWLYSDRTPTATSTAAWIYLALHGSYGLVWYLKDKTFPESGDAPGQVTTGPAKRQARQPDRRRRDPPVERAGEPASVGSGRRSGQLVRA